MTERKKQSRRTRAFAVAGIALNAQLRRTTAAVHCEPAPKLNKTWTVVQGNGNVALSFGH